MSWASEVLPFYRSILVFQFLSFSSGPLKYNVDVVKFSLSSVHFCELKQMHTIAPPPPLSDVEHVTPSVLIPATSSSPTRSLCVHVWGCSSSCSQAWPPSKPRCVGAIGVAWSCFRRRNPGQRPSRDPECGSEGSAECWADIITLPPNPCLWGILEQGPHVSGSEGGAVLNSPPWDAHCLGVYLDLLTQLVNLFLF